MANKRLVWVPALALIMLCPASFAQAWESEASRVCSGIPLAIVQGIVGVESNGDPYVIDVAMGPVWRAYRFGNVEDAKTFLQAALQVTQRIDIGLMQVNWHVWKGHIDATATELLDVTTNLKVGCTILAKELAGTGPLWQRIGRYHSRTPERNEHYALKVLHEAIRLSTQPVTFPRQ